MSKTRIIDISHHQLSSKINWDKAAKEVALFIIRVQYGSTTIDREYKKHVANCKKHGIPFGLYAYALFNSVEDAKVEAKDFLSRIDKDAKFLVVDVEEKTTRTIEEMGPATQAFIDVCKAAGWKTGLYTGHHVYKPFGLDRVKADFVWIPRYGTNDGAKQIKPDYPCEMWQYTSTGKVDWYNGNLDLNVLNGDKSIEWFMGGVAAPKIKEMQKKVVNEDSIYIVVKGDTLSGIAAKHKVTVDSLLKLNLIPNKDRIYPGQKIILNLPVTSKNDSKIYHKVGSGDTVSKLAAKYGSYQKQIQTWNNLDQQYMIKIGQYLRVK